MSTIRDDVICRVRGRIGRKRGKERWLDLERNREIETAAMNDSSCVKEWEARGGDG